MLNYNEIIEKLKDIISKELGNRVVFDKDIAKALDIEYNRFRQQKHRNIYIPYPEIMQFLAKRNISINWFFFEQLPASLIEETSKYILVKYQTNSTASAGGGAINDTLVQSKLIIDNQLLDHINSSYKYTEVIQVTGDSMEPDIKSGSLVFVDKNETTIKSSGVYLLNNREGLFVKTIKYQDSKYFMISLNDEYVDVKLDEFEIVGRVKGVFSKI